MKSVSFTGEIGGDGECFLWRGIPEADMRAVMGNEDYDRDLAFEREIIEDWNQWADNKQEMPTLLDQLDPGEICRALGCEDGKRYRFTISVEEVS